MQSTVWSILLPILINKYIIKTTHGHFLYLTQRLSSEDDIYRPLGLFLVWAALVGTGSLSQQPFADLVRNYILVLGLSLGWCAWDSILTTAESKNNDREKTGCVSVAYLHCKKRLSFSRPLPGCHSPNSPWPRIIWYFRPGRVWLLVERGMIAPSMPGYELFVNNFERVIKDFSL